MPVTGSVPPQEVFTVSRLNACVRLLLEDCFPLIWVEGEVSNLSRPGSGHLYFSLKDTDAQVRCALFRNRSLRSAVRPGNGLQVLVRARVSLYESRGDFQLIIEELQEAGAGALRRSLEALRLRLEREGLFEETHKRPLPRFPRRVGVITSPTGAAIRDVLSVLQRRFPALPVLLYPVMVQGQGAAEDIAETLALASRRRDCDALLLVRGGGSLEDLWAFNEEIVVRAIHACEIPLICGVGHETDTTLADFAADLRAPTPSVAAERVSPDWREWSMRIDALRNRLGTNVVQCIADHRRALSALTRRLARQHPGRRLQDRAQRLDELENRLQRALTSVSNRLRERLAGLAGRLQAQAPERRLRALREHHRTLARRLLAAMRWRLRQAAQSLASAGRTLHAVSPLEVLGRGYAILEGGDGALVRRVRQVKPGERIQALLADGRLVCEVREVQNAPLDAPLTDHASDGNSETR